MRPVARGMAEDRSELTQPLAATRRSTAEAGLREGQGRQERRTPCLVTLLTTAGGLEGGTLPNG